MRDYKGKTYSDPSRHSRIGGKPVKTIIEGGINKK